MNTITTKDGTTIYYKDWGPKNGPVINGFMHHRHACVNDLPIKESERMFRWDVSKPRPMDHAGLTDLGL